MPADPHKRELRNLKRKIKRAGSKHRRRDLKQQLVENPDGADQVDENFGKFSSVNFNGLDQDATRKREAIDPKVSGARSGSEGDGES